MIRIEEFNFDFSGVNSEYGGLFVLLRNEVDDGNIVIDWSRMLSFNLVNLFEFYKTNGANSLDDANFVGFFQAKPNYPVLLKRFETNLNATSEQKDGKSFKTEIMEKLNLENQNFNSIMKKKLNYKVIRMQYGA